MEQQLLTYGLYDGYELKHVADVENGMACNCVCPHCKHPLVAKNNPNNKKIAHFAHKSAKECDGAIETALHLLAKNVLSKTKRLKLPRYHFDYNSRNEKSIFAGDNTFIANNAIIFDEVLLEQPVTINGEAFIPDAVGKYKGRIIYIEFAKTHFVDDKKKEKIKQAGNSCIEIDLRGLTLDEDVINNFLCEDTPFKYWLSNPVLDKRYNEHKLQQYRQDNCVEVFTLKKGMPVQNGRLYCPRKAKRYNELKHDDIYQRHPKLKAIIDSQGYIWNGKMYGGGTNGKWIFLKKEKIVIFPADGERSHVTQEENEKSRLLYKGLKELQSSYDLGYCYDCKYSMDKIIVDDETYEICGYKASVDSQIYIVKLRSI